MITQAQRHGLYTKAVWAHDHANRIGYWETRLMRTRELTWQEFVDKVLAGEMAEGDERGVDCSEFVTLLFHTEGLGDPNGQRFSGVGNTQYMLSHLPNFTNPSKIHTGTIGIYTAGPLSTQHAVMALGANPKQPNNPWVVSHGGSNGPIFIPALTLLQYLPGRHLIWLEVDHL